MKKCLLLLTSVLLAIGCETKSQPSTPVEKHGQLKVEGTQLTDKHGNPTMLRGMSYGWHNFWPRFYNKQSVKWLKNDWNVNIVRAAMGVDADEQCYINNPEDSKEKIKAVVDGAIEAGIYVIIDFHSHNIHLEETKTFFNEMSKTYGGTPNVIYEVFNEPDDESWADVKAYSEEVIKVIRKNDPDNIILVGCPHWDQDIHLPAEDPIIGFDNLMYTVHFYAATHDKWLRDRTDAAMEKGLPVFVSESAGMEATGDGPLDEEEWQRWIDWMENRKLSWITWSVSDKDETCSVLKKSASSTGNWKASDLKESGKKSREYLKKLNK